MGYLSDLAASLVTQIDLVPTFGEKDELIRQLAEVRQAIGAVSGGGGGGGGGDATAINQVTGNNLLSAIANRTPLLGAKTIAESQPVSIALDQVINIRDQSATTPISQLSIALAANDVGEFIIPTSARSLTICVTSQSLVHYTEDGSVPTTANCWFAGGSKEIWDYAVPAGATIKLRAVSASIILIQIRV